MDKKGAIRISILAIGLLLVGFVVFFSLLSSAVIVKDKYVLGEKVKIELENIGSYKIKIITPTTNFVKQGNEKELVFDAKEVGTHKIILNYNGKTEEYSFNVVEQKTEPETSENNLPNVTDQNISRGDIKERIKVKMNSRSQAGSELNLGKKENGEIEIRKDISDEWKIKSEDSFKVILEEEGEEINFEASDLDGDGYLDEIIWAVEDTGGNLTFEIIVITKAEHLDVNKEFISNIYEEVKEKDDIWSETINDGEHVRVTFETPLSNGRDITVWPRIVSGTPRIEVYEYNKSEIVMRFDNLVDNEYNKRIFENLNGSQDTFDLRVINGSLEFDHIVDPLSSNFTDGAATGSISTTPTANTTVATLATDFPAGTNLVLAPVQVLSTDAGTENIPIGGLTLMRNDGTILASNQYAIQVSTANLNNNYFILALDSGAGANAGYNLTGYSSATAVNTEAKITAISGLQHVFFNDSISIAFSANAETEIASLATNFTSGGNVIIASIQIDNGGTGQTIAASGIAVKNASGATISSNEYDIIFGTVAPTDIQSIVLLGYEANAPANAVYNVSILGPQAGNAEAKFAVFRVNGAQFLDGGSVNIGNAAKVNVGDMTNNFPTGSELLIIAAGQVDDTDGGIENLAADTGFTLEENANVVSASDLIMSAFAASGTAGDGIRQTLMWRNSSSIQGTVYNLTATASALQLRAELKMLILQLTDTFYPNVTLNSPVNGYNSSSGNIVFNATAQDETAIANVSLWANFTGTYQMNQTNSSGLNGNYLFNITNIPDGGYIWAVQACDTSNNCNITENRSILIDSTFPLIDYGIGTENDQSNFSRDYVYVNVSVIELFEANITFNLYNTTGLVNSTGYTSAVRTINWTGLPNGVYTYNVSVRDIVNHLNSTSTRTMRLDTRPPSYSNSIESPIDPAIYSLGQFYQFNVSWADNLIGIQTVFIEHNFTGSFANYSVSNNGAVYYYNTANLAAGGYSWRMHANDSLNNINQTDLFTYTINKATSSVNLTLNGIDGNITVQTGSTVNLTGYKLAGEGVIRLYNNGTLINQGNGPLENLTLFNTIGTFNITVIYESTQNYSQSSRTNYIFVQDLTKPNVTLNAPVNGYNSTSNLIFNATALDETALVNVSLWTNFTGTYQINQTNSSGLNGNYLFNVTNIPDGGYIWAVQACDTSNNCNITENRSITIDSTPPSISLLYPGNNTNITQSFVNFTWNATDNIGQIFCNLTVDGTVNASEISSNNGLNTSYLVSGFDDGLHNWSVTCRDRLNSNNSVTRIFTVYTITPPTAFNISLDGDNSRVILRWSNVTKAGSYNIYISTNYSAGFSSTPNFTGITDLNFTDSNANASLKRFYKVGAVNGPAENITVLSVGKIQTPQLSSSFNLLSLPLNLSNYVLNNGANNGYNIPTQPSNCIQSLFRYNGTRFQETTNDNGVWTPSIGDSDFISLEPMRGYWFETDQSCNVTFIGEVPMTNISAGLNYSFNVVSWFSAYSPRLGEEAVLGNPFFVTPANAIDNIFRYNVSKAVNNPQQGGFQGLHHFSGYGWWPFFGDEDFTSLESGSGYYFEVPNAPANWTHNPNFNN